MGIGVWQSWPSILALRVAVLPVWREFWVLRRLRGSRILLGMTKYERRINGHRVGQRIDAYSIGASPNDTFGYFL